MAETGSYAMGFHSDIEQILSEAEHRWLRPPEICEILRNSEKFRISADAPTKPVSGSVFLFDRKVLRYFRKDGHNWRKKKDGKTIKEAHEKLKVGSVDMLHCYYAHGEDNENFQRRSYWLLEQDLMHIVFVHYLEVKSKKTDICDVRNSGRLVSNSGNDSSLSSSFCGTSPTSTLTSAYEDAESEGNHQASSRFHLHPESPLADDAHSVLSRSCNQILSPGNQSASAMNHASLLKGHQDEYFGGCSIVHGVEGTLGLASWQEILENPPPGEHAYKQENGFAWSAQSSCQVNNMFEEKPLPSGPEQKQESEQRNLQMLFANAEPGNTMNPEMEDPITMGNESVIPKKPLIGGLQTDESLKKVDSFSRWMSKELGEVDDFDVQLSSEISWSIVGNGYDSNMPAQLPVDTHTLNPSVSQDQLFSISDFSPNWAYSNLETKVIVTGTFLKGKQELYNCRWSIMFGEVEVPAEVFADGNLWCYAPLHKPGLVPFYITCSNRLACSEIREFEYRFGTDQNRCTGEIKGESETMMHLYKRFETILCLEPSGSPVHSAGDNFEKQSAISNIISLIEENNQEARLISENDTLNGDLFLEMQLKDKFYSWLLQRVTEDGKGLMIMHGGQNVLHLAAALGYNWALQPIILSGVSIDFRDVNGWTALHWAAFCGREETVAALVSMGASPGALTDPSAEEPLGRTPADLASSSGHKGISGFVAESSLTSHLSTLRVKDDGVSERIAVPETAVDVPETLSLKDSLAAVCNAAHTAARIHQIYRIQSFQRKQLTEQDSDYLLGGDEHAISLMTAKATRLGRSDGMANAAAVRIQKKYRGWKKRQEFLLIREKIVKIQAHIRGHQVRRKYKPFIWSVGILEKVILRWRRKRSGLRGFRADALQKDTTAQGISPQQEDDYDFLKVGRKQTEERMQKALARVQSMAQYPEARAQYRRLLTTTEGLREAQGASEMIPDNMDCATDDLIDIECLLDDDTFMSLTFQ